MAFASRAPLRSIVTAAVVVAVLSEARFASAETVVQISVDTVLDGRSVSTVANGVVTPWSAGEGVDNDGNGDGFVTTAVEAILQTQGKTEGGKIGNALPDEGTFVADTRHPAIVLHFSNAAPTTSPQTHQVHQNKGSQSFQLAVLPATYSKMFLFITASEGGAALTITFTYAAGAAPTVMKLMLPDYGIGGAAANDPVFFNLIANMHKWTATDQETDVATHTITGIELAPSATATLTNIQVEKTNGSHVVFWGATGIATGAVDAGASSDGSTGTLDASASDGPADIAGAGGATDAGGSAAAGSSGMGGTSGTAPGSTGTAGTTSTGAGGSSVSTGAAGTGATSNLGRSSGGGCSLSGAPARNRASLLALTLIFGLVMRRRRRPLT